MSISKQKEKKIKALNYFTKKILNSNVKDEIAKMILFGSLVRGGRIHKESDVDVLIFSFKKPTQQLENIIDDASFDALMKYKESVEPLIYRFQDFKYPKSSFIYEALMDGRELYSSFK